jgi:hypothetical protein
VGCLNLLLSLFLELLVKVFPSTLVLGLDFLILFLETVPALLVRDDLVEDISFAFLAFETSTEEFGGSFNNGTNLIDNQQRSQRGCDSQILPESTLGTQLACPSCKNASGR